MPVDPRDDEALLFHGSSLVDGDLLAPFGGVGEILETDFLRAVQDEADGSLLWIMVAEKKDAPAEVGVEQGGEGDKQGTGLDFGLGVLLPESHPFFSSVAAPPINPIFGRRHFLFQGCP